jgi:alkylated DNA repair dioxygenase AlkB
VGRGRYLGDGLVEDRLIGVRGFGRSTQLADELKRGSANFIVGGGRLEIRQGLDVAAHGVSSLSLGAVRKYRYFHCPVQAEGITFRGRCHTLEYDTVSADQLDIFRSPRRLPEGFRYQPDLLSSLEEDLLLRQIEVLPFREFEFQGFLGKRRVVSYGWRYNFNDRELQKADDIPAFLLPIRETAARFAGIPPGDLQHILVTEYSPGAAIGWHRDKAMFGDVIGISLLSSCIFRLRRKIGTKWERASVNAAPRSAYLLRGPSRTEWEHSIPPVDHLRYSLTFRNLLDSED